MFSRLNRSRYTQLLSQNLLESVQQNSSIKKPRRLDGKKIRTIYQGGLNNSKFTHMTKYLGSDGYVHSSTGEIVWSEGCKGRQPIKTVYAPIEGNEMHDIDTNYYPSSWFSEIVAYFQHRAMRNLNEKEGVKVFEDPYSIKHDLSTLKSYVQLFSNMSMGQEADITSFEADYHDWALQHAEDEGFIAYGVSRGAALTANALAMKNPDGTYKYPGAKLAILEGIYYSVEHLLEEKNLSMLHRAAPLLFKQYKPDGLSPGKSIADYPAGLPTVIITSKVDEVVPFNSAKRFAEELAAKGQNDVYLLVLNNSKHPRYMYDNDEDREKYEAFINAIYKKYGFCHDVELAAKGEQYLEEAMLSKADNTNVSQKVI